jgi:hypothetical protein
MFKRVYGLTPGKWAAALVEGVIGSGGIVISVVPATALGVRTQ